MTSNHIAPEAGQAEPLVHIFKDTQAEPDLYAQPVTRQDLTMPDDSSDSRDDASFSIEERRLMTHVEKVNVRSQTRATYVFAVIAAVLIFIWLMNATVPLNKTKFLSTTIAAQITILITITRLNVLRCYSVIQKLQKQPRIEH